jgi:DNA-binding transcriptional MerR regulator
MGLIRLAGKERNRNQFKDYPETILRRLLAIKRIKDYGFTLQETLGMLILFEEGVLEPERGLRFIKRKIDRIDEKISEMKEMRKRLEEVVSTGFTGYCPLGKILKEMGGVNAVN